MTITYNNPENFWKKVDKTDSCWNWTGAKHNGYGQFTVSWSPTNKNPWQCKTVRAHRWAYEQLIGPIPEELTIDHECENRACVRPGPGHCVPRDAVENAQRASTNITVINRNKTHCVRGHEFTPLNTLRRKARPNERECRTCINHLARERRKKKQ